jgi:hypothetical protein
MTNKQRSLLSIPIAAVKRLVLATCLLVIPMTIQSCTLPAQSVNITGATKSMQFRFEDYKTAEAAQKKLLELYPVGSDVSKFVKDMQSIGYEYLPPDDLKDGLKIVGFQHFIPINAAGSDTWYVRVFYKSDGKITELRLDKSFSSF